MAEVRRTTKVQEKEIRSYLDRMETDMIESLRHGNIYEVFAKSKFKIADFQDFFSNQWKTYKGNVIQDEDIKSAFSSYHSPDINQFPVHSKGKAFTQQEQQMLREGMSSAASQGGKFKAMKVKGGDVGEDMAKQPDAEAPMSYEELQDAARGTLDDWDGFLSDVWLQIMDAQMMSDYRTKMAEIKGEVDRLIALAKQGVIGPEFVLIALAKVNCMKNGVLISWLGKKAFHVNESINNVAQDLHSLDPADPRYFGEMQMAQSTTRDKSFQLNLLTQDMQKAMQDVASVMEQVHGMMAEINRTRREIVQKIGARG